MFKIIGFGRSAFRRELFDFTYRQRLPSELQKSLNLTVLFSKSIYESSVKKKIQMVETAPVQIAVAPAPAKAPKVKKPASKPTHPPTAQLVIGAIKALQERSGSSFQAIKKFIAEHDKLDADKLSPFIKKFLKKATASGNLIQTRGKGASGSFKLSAASLKPKAEKKKKPVAKKAAGVKKVGGAKKAAKPKAKKTDKPKKKLAPKQKSLKPSKSKPKAPKPKKAQAKKPVTAAKKAAKPATK